MADDLVLRLGGHAAQLIDTLGATQRALGDVVSTLRAAAGETRQAARTQETFEQSLKRTGDAAQTIGRSWSVAVTAPIVGGLGLASKAAIDFESSFAGVRKTVEASEAEFAVLQRDLRNLAKQIPVNVNELNRIGEAAGQLGIETENLVSFTRVMADLGVSTNMSSDQAATALARLANITQMPQTEFDRLGATVVDLGNNLATTESEIVDFGLRIAGAGKIAGLTEPQILAIGGAMSSVGVQAEAGGTAVQKVLLGITQAVATGNQDLTVFAATAGMSADQFARAWREDAGQAFAAFVEGLGRQGDQAFQTLEALGLQDQRLIRSFLSLANAGDVLRDSLARGTRAWQENTALTKEAEQRYQTAEKQFQLAKNELNDVAITLGGPVTRALVTVLQESKPLILFLADLAEGFAALPQPVQTFGLVTAGVGSCELAAAASRFEATNSRRSMRFPP